MKIYNAQDYPNLLEFVNLTSEQIKEQIITFRLTFIQVRNKFVEWGVQLPMFVNAFYDYVIQYQAIPNQNDFWEHYRIFNAEYFNHVNFDDETMYGVKARCFRTYPSLVRDIFFNKYVSEQLQGKATVVYSIDLDVREGIDMMIVESNGENKAVNLYVNTQRALIGRQKKESRHISFDNVEYVEFPVDFKGSEKIGDFFMYGKQEYEKLQQYL